MDLGTFHCSRFVADTVTSWMQSQGLLNLAAGLQAGGGCPGPKGENPLHARRKAEHRVMTAHPKWGERRK